MKVEDFYSNCSTAQKQELAELLLADNFIFKNDDRFKPNLNEQIFLDSLNALSKKRHCLSKEEEDYVNELANKFKYF